EDLLASCVENKILQDSFGPSNDNSNVANALREPFVVNLDPGNNSSQSPPQISNLKEFFIINVLFLVIHQPPQEMSIHEMEDLKQQYLDEMKRLINSEYRDEIKGNFNITPSLSTEEPDNSLSMRDEHLDTISATELDEFIKSSVKNLVPIPNVPKKLYSNPMFDEEIIPMRIDPHHFNAESDLIESLLNNDSSIIPSSKIDSLFDEFVEFVSANSDTKIESFSPSPIPVEDSDSLMKEINLFFTLDYPMLPGIEEDDYDFERDTLILKDLLSNDTLSLPEIKSVHFDIPLFSRPLAKPPDGKRKQEKDKIETKPDKIKIKREAWKSPT
nr:hypothetical protein [Tanacetum cinerariifolium]